MIFRAQQNRLSHFQAGFSYVEVMIATVILVVALVPMMDALQTGIQGATIHQSMATDHYQLVAKTEEVLAESFDRLLSAAAAAGNNSTASSYSDAPGSSQRRLVLLSFYDGGNSDGDNDPFTIKDDDKDGDNNPYTGTDVDLDLLWLRVEIENTALAFESLTSR